MVQGVSGELRDVGEPPVQFYDASSWEGVSASSHRSFAQITYQRMNGAMLFPLSFSQATPIRERA